MDDPKTIINQSEPEDQDETVTGCHPDGLRILGRIIARELVKRKLESQTDHRYAKTDNSPASKDEV